MSILRKIERNKLKIKQENNKIRKAWRIHQIDKYSIEGYCELYNKNVNKKEQKISPKTAYNV